MAEVDSKLVAALKQAKTTPMFFVFVAKGTEGKLLVDKKKISPKDASDAKKACGGGTIYKGRCQGEEGKLVFEMGKEAPGTLSALTKKIIKQTAGLTLDVEYRFAQDLAAEESQTESPSEGAAPEARSVPPAETPTKAGADPAAEFRARLAEWSPAIKAALAAKGPNAASIAKLLTQATALSKPGGDMGQALAKLTESHELATALAAPETIADTDRKPPKGPSLAVLQQTRLAWDHTRKTIQAELQKLEKSILAACEADEEFGNASVNVGILHGILTRLDTRLIDKLDQALNAEDPAQRAEFNQEAKGIVNEYVAFVNESPLMADIDDSGFVPVAIRSTAVASLNLLSSKL